MLARLGDEMIVLDAGTGILELGPRLPKGTERLSILLSHPHLDHVMGIPGFAMLMGTRLSADFYAVPRSGLSAREQAGLVMRQPLWPVGAEAIAREAVFHDVAGDFSIGEVNVSLMESDHPGGSTVYRLERGGESVVYATDFEHGKRSAELAELARGCSVLIYDAQFTDAEYELRRGWGHSTWREGLAVAERAGVGRLVLTHHSPRRTDAELDALSAELINTSLPCSFGKCGEEIWL